MFIIHEMRVRGFHPFQPVAPTVPDDIPWQDWILSNQVFDNASDSLTYFDLNEISLNVTAHHATSATDLRKHSRRFTL
jgi:hypothetical protein